MKKHKDVAHFDHFLAFLFSASINLLGQSPTFFPLKETNIKLPSVLSLSFCPKTRAITSQHAGHTCMRMQCGDDPSDTSPCLHTQLSCTVLRPLSPSSHFPLTPPPYAAITLPCFLRDDASGRPPCCWPAPPPPPPACAVMTRTTIDDDEDDDITAESLKDLGCGMGGFRRRMVGSCICTCVCVCMGLAEGSVWWVWIGEYGSVQG